MRGMEVIGGGVHDDVRSELVTPLGFTCVSVTSLLSVSLVGDNSRGGAVVSICRIDICGERAAMAVGPTLPGDASGSPSEGLCGAGAY